MEKLKLKYDSLLKAYSALANILEAFTAAQQTNTDENTILIYRDSLIQRFEICFDLTWKYLKLYLDNTHGIQVTSPKSTFQECLKQNIINPKETKQCLQMVDDRNDTTHTYDEELAHKISERVSSYYNLMNQIAQRTTPGNKK